ncbi:MULTISPECIES: Cro/CI family transcriptional regulator [unclassified Pseudomonas]|uniref:Cro/CI family transcriptional regulator n=1 Tax=unclassified Pseudomonas TaxID=196821 RepID=UPI000A099D19|nr:MULTISPECIES: Cro/CI family transcriptional regulator [unclassified Pseudomonas]SMF36883.1 DNA-binding transcriptional regulator Cro [Pseudomonas sp. LAIL14HWK12:I11]SMR78970.1 DNA-binding transcriptional regulator Cro [Pseudomonas sp. LAIL14HWK12:I10]SOD04728.1 DNA-binding transcriptional regulator Cro [Pseudomonas sp. LAIL14HWK12:I8]
MKTRDAAKHFGSKKKLADALGIQPSAVTMWGEVVPISRQYQLQILSGGALMADAKSSPEECGKSDKAGVAPVDDRNTCESIQ